MSISINSIVVVLTGEVPLVWRHDDAVSLRTEHRIMGRLNGCLPGLPRQNEQLGLPLQLTKEETKLMIENGICKLVRSEPMKKPSENQISDFNSRRQKLYKEQVEVAKEERRKEILQNKEKIIEGKKKKLKKELRKRKAEGEDIDEKELDDPTVVFNIDDIYIPLLPDKNQLIQISIANPTAGNEQPVMWDYPCTETEKLRYSVYKDLWERGYFITSGAKFGGDFLVYPGDPARYHSFYIVVCLLEDQELSTVDISALSRMGSNVKKTILLCSMDTTLNKVEYTSLQWAAL